MLIVDFSLAFNFISPSKVVSNQETLDSSICLSNSTQQVKVGNLTFSSNLSDRTGCPFRPLNMTSASVELLLQGTVARYETFPLHSQGFCLTSTKFSLGVSSSCKRSVFLQHFQAFFVISNVGYVFQTNI